jgi:Tfp pilus assembly protein PilF|tara:strand:+ start:46 stop:312 length:267 start_codon:yes stop_codon:yes gene_type:complete
MIKNNLTTTAIMAIALTWLTACSVGPKIDPQQQQLAADIYAQLSLGYMESGQLALAQQRLQKAQALNPNGMLTLKAAKKWQQLQLTQP